MGVVREGPARGRGRAGGVGREGGGEIGGGASVEALGRGSR